MSISPCPYINAARISIYGLYHRSLLTLPNPHSTIGKKKRKNLSKQAKEKMLMGQKKRKKRKKRKARKKRKKKRKKRKRKKKMMMMKTKISKVHRNRYIHRSIKKRRIHKVILVSISEKYRYKSKQTIKNK
jgi:hypothetical protein